MKAGGMIFLDESMVNGLAQTQYSVKTSKLKTNSKTWRWTCYGVELHFVQKHGKFSVYIRNIKPRFVFENIKGQFEAIC